ncbi:MAG: hypothetical protein MUF49_13390 [Oculatellaceae cyanobacterium Prado106]|jgi:tetratricopeptide (TPR) repeat protein|nr:hypothetical protein [Oculatellaceae cyanobacterium Prado106]
MSHSKTEIPQKSSQSSRILVGQQSITHQRLDAYLELITALVKCPKGKELALLQVNQALVDSAFVQVMDQVAQQMQDHHETKTAHFLQDWAEELRNTLEQTSPEAPSPNAQDPQQEFQQERIQTYMTLIKELINCRKGTEQEILNANPHLVDNGLVEQIKIVGTMLAEKGDEADARFLLGLAHQLSVSLTPATPSVHLTLLNQILQTIEESNGNPQVVYELLQANLEYLDDTFVEVLQASTKATFKVIEPAQALQLATTLVVFGNLMQQFPLGDHSQHVEIALMSFQMALSVFQPDNHPQNWALIQKCQGVLYTERQKGDKAENLETAIACFQFALQVYTQDSFPTEWANLQTHLGEAYHHRIMGDRTENLERAIAALQAAIQVYRCPASA